MLEVIKKRAAIQSYRTQLGTFLAARHGKRSSYTTQQVQQCASEHGLDLLFICYAFAMFTTRDAFNSHHAASGRNCDYDLMRAEIRDTEGSVQATGYAAEHSWVDSEEADNEVGDRGDVD